MGVQPCNKHDISHLGTPYDIKILEDACHALGERYNNPFVATTNAGISLQLAFTLQQVSPAQK